MPENPPEPSTNQPLDLTAKLVCPRSQSALIRYDLFFVCSDPACRLAFPIWDDIPVLLIDEAVELPPDEWRDACG